MVAVHIATKKFTELDCSVCKEIKVSDNQLIEIICYPEKEHQLIVENKEEGVLKLYTKRKEVFVKPTEDGGIEKMAVANIVEPPHRNHSKAEMTFIDNASMLYGGFMLLFDSVDGRKMTHTEQCKYDFIIESLWHYWKEVENAFAEEESNG